MQEELSEEEPLFSILKYIQGLSTDFAKKFKKHLNVYGTEGSYSIPRLVQLDLVLEEPFRREYNVLTLRLCSQNKYEIISNNEINEENSLEGVKLQLASILKNDYEYDEILRIESNFRLNQNNKALMFDNFRLTKEEELNCIIKMKQGDQEAKDKLIRHYLRFVKYIVNKFDVDNKYSEELFTVGAAGLKKALESFQPDKGVTLLKTYVTRCIENEILMHIRSSNNEARFSQKSSSLGDEAFDQEYNNMIFELLLEEIRLDNNFFFNLNSLDRDELKVILSRLEINIGKPKSHNDVVKETGLSLQEVIRIERQALIKIFEKNKQKSLIIESDISES
ncbi:hypothetical protein J1TS5_03730 [Paenibacillus macerans]|uniref:sigma-70 family RNA polymerase sigma factor n=1 Tax=Paenibacillus macerans TaxID=44252 RepID=UPI001B046439|nr:sigma-70 family RNA polymerase sigma factor [Paenibacillus macerans]GIP08203.1 hypothetical protein J1TS5_03730 [Paenibacillus macerans]